MLRTRAGSKLERSQARSRSTSNQDLGSKTLFFVKKVLNGKKASLLSPHFFSLSSFWLKAIVSENHHLRAKVDQTFSGMMERTFLCKKNANTFIFFSLEPEQRVTVNLTRQKSDTDTKRTYRRLVYRRISAGKF